MNLCLKCKIFITKQIVILTFHCKKTMYLSHVNGKSDRGNASEKQAA